LSALRQVAGIQTGSGSPNAEVLEQVEAALAGRYEVQVAVDVHQLRGGADAGRTVLLDHVTMPLTLGAVGLVPVEAFHLNEGHSAFAILELARSVMNRDGRSFPDAREAYDGTNGFAIGCGGEHSDPKRQDELDVKALYDVLENEILPLFYNRDEHGVPRGWVARQKNAIRTLARRFCADRMMMDYTLRCYLPAAGGLSASRQSAPC
jgi:glucan phosphorylase